MSEHHALPNAALCLDLPAVWDGSPLLVAIATHHHILEQVKASAPFDGNCEARVALDGAELDALQAVITTPCASLADAAALLGHIQPYVEAGGSAFGVVLRDTGELACAVAEAILRALAVALRGDVAESGLAVPDVARLGSGLSVAA